MAAYYIVHANASQMSLTLSSSIIISSASTTTSLDVIRDVG